MAMRRIIRPAGRGDEPARPVRERLPQSLQVEVALMRLHSSPQLVETDDAERVLADRLVRGVARRNDPLVASACESTHRDVSLWGAVIQDPPAVSTCLGLIHGMLPTTMPVRLAVLAPKPWQWPALIVEPDGIGVLVRMEDGVSPRRIGGSEPAPRLLP